jgi:hypothetical protein
MKVVPFPRERYASPIKRDSILPTCSGEIEVMQ